jgi:integrase/recombinase XerD
MKSNLSLKFYLNTSKTNSGELPIYLRLTYQRRKSELYTGFKTPLKKWDQSSGETKSDLIINRNLSELKSKAYELFTDRIRQNLPINATILKDLLTGKDKAEIGLIRYFQKHINEITLKNEIEKVSLNKYKQSLESLQSFLSLKFNASDLNIVNIQFTFINDYDLYLKAERNLHKNTINKYHSRLRTLLLKALNEGLIQKNPYANFKLINTKTQRQYLSDQEITQLLQVDLSHNQSLDKIRDVFLFSLYTGIRFQDAQDLSINNLHKESKSHFIRFVQKKTGTHISIPIINQVISIIDKYKNIPERIVLKKLLPKISNQKINAYLKIIGELANINKPITHHIARHTFATTICLNNNVPLEDLSKLLGHSSIKTTQIYGRITEQRLEKSIQNIQNKIRHEKK